MSIRDVFAWVEHESWIRAKNLLWDGKISEEFFHEHWGVVPPLDPPGYKEYLKAKWPNGDRLKLAMNLSPTVEVCRELLLGHYVDPARLDQDWLRWAKREKFVALKSAIECL